VNGLGAEHLEPARPIPGPRHLELIAKRLPHHFTVHALVIHDQDMARRARVAPLRIVVTVSRLSPFPSKFGPLRQAGPGLEEAFGDPLPFTLGHETVKVEPFPTSLSRTISPPNLEMSF